MSRSSKQEAGLNALRMIPTKWAIAIVAILIGYVLLQPRLNQWFGWNLPSIASIVGDEKKPPPKNESEKEKVKGKSDSSKGAKKNSPDNGEHPSDNSRISQNKPSPKSTHPTSSEQSSEHEDEVNEKPAPLENAPSRKTSRPSPEEDKTQGAKKPDVANNTFGYLTPLGRNRFESPAGLVYGPGSEEGHRLKHIARHLVDQPNRPGSHGVFEGDMKAFLIAIDDGYSRAKRGAKGTKKTDEDDSTVYEASFEKAIGFLGGQEGGRKRHPPIKRLRIVVRDNAVITAFPF